MNWIASLLFFYKYGIQYPMKVWYAIKQKQKNQAIYFDQHY